MKTRIYIMLLLILVVSCKPKSLEIEDIGQAEQKLSVSTFLIPGNRLMIGVTKSFDALEDVSGIPPAELLQNQVVDEAEVTLHVRDEVYNMQLHSSGVYLLEDFNRYTNETYTLIVQDKQTGLAISAQTQLKEKVEFNYVKLGSKQIGKDSVPEVTYNFYDLEGESYYMINVDIVLEHQTLSDEFEIKKPFTHLISDKGNEGKLLSGEFAVILDQEFKQDENVVITLSSISESYYKYLKAKKERDMGVEFISEPFNLNSNIQGGYGYFNLIEPDIHIKVYGM